MKRFLLSLVFLLSFSIACFCEDPAKWNIEKSTHFIVYYKNAPEDFIKQVIGHSEQYYEKIASDLGFNRFDFWLWDDRAKIYIYDDSADYQADTGQPAWSAGSADPREKKIATFPYAAGFFETVLAHEMGHIVFREIVGFNNNALPLWLDEGVASYQEKTKYYDADGAVVKSIADGSFIPLNRLANFGEQFSLPQSRAELFYAESFSVVNFLIRQFGKEKFINFCRNLKEKKNLNKALESSYPFRNAGELEDAWKKNLKNE